MTDMKPFIVTSEETISSPGETGLLEPTDIDSTGSNYRVILYNDEWHGFEEVITQVQKATGCTTAQAEAVTVEAHYKGRAICFKGERDKCQEVCRVLREIRLQCEVDCD